MPIPVASDAELLASVPYLLGFRPHSSLVILGLEDGGVALSARLDLPGETAQRHAWTGVVLGLATRYAPARVALIGFDPHAGCGPLLRLVAARLRRNAIAVAPLLLSGPTGWRHLDPGTCTLCPGAGHTMSEREMTAVAAEFVVRGRAPFPSRDALAESLAPDVDYLADCELPRDPSPPSDRAEGAWRAMTDVDRDWQPEPSDLVALASSAALGEWRDALLARMVPGLVPIARLVPHLARRAEVTVPTIHRAEDAVVHMSGRHVLHDRLRLLARRTPGPLAAGPYAMLAVFSGSWGDGATAVLAAEQALRADPGHVLATLVLRLYACGGSLAAPDAMIARPVG